MSVTLSVGLVGDSSHIRLVWGIFCWSCSPLVKSRKVMDIPMDGVTILRK